MHWLLSRNVVFVLFAVFQIYECKRQEQENQPRSVNLALETVLEFDNYENSADITIIDKVQTFLNKVKSVIKKNKGFRRAGDEEVPLSFTDFVKSALVILTSYSDDDLEEIASVLDVELRKYHYKGCKFYEIVENENLRRFMADQLHEIKIKSGKQLKRKLKAVLKFLTDDNRGFKHKLISRYLDSLYTEEDGKAFNKFLRHLALYRRKTKRTNMNINKIIRHGLRNIIFDHYSKLDVDTRRDFKVKLATFWKDFSGKVTSHILKLESKPRSKIDRFIPDKTIEISKEELDSKTPKPKKREHKIKKKRVKRQRKTTTPQEVIEEPMKVTKAPRLSFITLYPEAITFVKRHHKKSHKKHKSINPSTGMDTRRVTLLLKTDQVPKVSAPKDNLPKGNLAKDKFPKDKFSKDSFLRDSIPKYNIRKDSLLKESFSKDSFPSNKKLISDVKFEIDVKGVNMKSGHALKKSRFNADSSSNEAKPSSDPYTIRKRVFTFQKDLSGDSDEGLAIDVFQSTDDEQFSYKGPIRKSNVNDKLTNKPKLTNPIITTTTSATTSNEDYIKRIDKLETELKDVKEHLRVKNQVKPSTQKSIEETHFDVLEFWERPTTLPTVKTIKVKKTKKTTTSTTPATSKPTTIFVSSKNSHHHHHKKKTTAATTVVNVESTTENTPKPRPPPKPSTIAVFRSSDQESTEENNEIIPKLTTKTTEHYYKTTTKTTKHLETSTKTTKRHETTTKTTKRDHDRVDLKSRGTKTLSVTSKPTHKTTLPTSTTEVLNITSTTTTKAVETTPEEVEVEPTTENSFKAKVDAFLKEGMDEDTKVDLVKQQMMKDFQKLMPSTPETIETLGTPTEPLSVAKLASTDDVLDILDDGDDILKK